MLYESIEVSVIGIVGDGGGSNEGFMTNIAEHFNLDMTSPNVQAVSFPHPFDKEQRIFLWSCSTHSIKATRNNIYRSQIGKSRNLRRHGVFFRWKSVVQIYDREFAREKKNQLKQSDITKNTIALDNFTMMNPTYAK